MLQIKIFSSADMEKLTASVNEFLSSINDESVKQITINETATRITIQYTVEEAWAKALCCDCQYWDDGGSVETTNGLCQECGQRRRFNCKACKHFKDIRG